MLAAGLRLGPRLFPVRGWTLLTESLHPLIAGGDTDLIHRASDGLDIRLDLSDYIQRSIFYQAYEPAELAFARAILRPGDVMVDVGAHVGIFSLVAARRVGSAGQVHAFEPVPVNFERLAENVALNRLGNIVLNQAAAGLASGELLLGLDPGMESGGYAVGLPRDQVSVPVVNLDEYIAKHLGNRSIRFVKIDVEGYERQVLGGMPSALEKQQIDFLMIEINVYVLSRLGAAIRDVVEQLQHPGYRLFRLSLPGFVRRWSYRGEPAAIPRDDRGGVLRIVRGMRDRTRNFNLIAIRAEHPGAASNPQFIRIASLGRA